MSSYTNFEDEQSNIDFYIASVCGFNNLLKSLLRKDPKTRTAILGASYKEVLTLRTKAHEALRLLEEVERRKTLTAAPSEVAMIAAEQDELLCES